MLKDLGSAVAQVARKNIGRPALWAKGETLTYGELAAQAAGVTAALLARGVAPGDRVAILSERSTDAYVSILGTLFAGAAYVPLNTRFPTDRNRVIVESADASVLVCSQAQTEAARKVLENLPNVNLIISSELDRHAIDQLPCEINSGSLAYVFFTSGTTGVPKGVPISHENVFAYLRGIRTVCTAGLNDRVMQVVDLTFDLSVHDIFLAWTSGATLVSIPENGTLLSTRFVQEHGGTHWLSVPSAAALVKQVGLLHPGSLPSLKVSLFCGEALSGTVAESWAAAAPNSEIINIYGPTEATVAFTAYRYRPGTSPVPPTVPLGEPFPEQRMGLFDAQGNEVADEVAEICLSGSQLTEGYWNLPEITAERFFNTADARWYRTGDLGRYDPVEGYIYLGRADRQVKLRGYRVELQEIESAILDAAKCDMAAVVPWPLDATGAALGCVGFIVGGWASDETFGHLRAKLPDYMVPSKIQQVSELPLNANGKVDHRALSAMLVNDHG